MNTSNSKMVMQSDGRRSDEGLLIIGNLGFLVSNGINGHGSKDGDKIEIA